MNTVFIVNPKAGQGKNIENLTKEIASTNAMYYVTKSVGDAENFVRNYCKTKGPARFIACGGDGTLNEVLNGIAGFDAEIGVLPIGTGNDFCRNFEGDFHNVRALIEAPCQSIDVIRYTTNGNARLCANMFNIGFDCNVADMVADMKKKPFISGSLAYFMSILVALIKKKGANLKLEIDDKPFFDGPILLTSVANGKFCGGGIMSNPLSDICDGYINVNVIYNIPRRSFIPLLPRYMKGTLIKLKNIEKFIYNTKCKKLRITPNTQNFRICADGEIHNADVVEFEILPKSIRFVTPKKDA
jgi:YegS/Rv2252/BmrU family lipid kinase